MQKADQSQPAYCRPPDIIYQYVEFCVDRFPNYEHSILVKDGAISDRYALWSAISKTTLAGIAGIAYKLCPICGSGIRGDGIPNAYYTCECGTTISAVRISLRTNEWIVVCFYVPIANLMVEEDII